jgi:hypothetical protein
MAFAAADPARQPPPRTITIAASSLSTRACRRSAFIRYKQLVERVLGREIVKNRN